MKKRHWLLAVAAFDAWPEGKNGRLFDWRGQAESNAVFDRKPGWTKAAKEFG